MPQDHSQNANIAIDRRIAKLLRPKENHQLRDYHFIDVIELRSAQAFVIQERLEALQVHASSDV